jgi:hypothetical protein
MFPQSGGLAAQHLNTSKGKQMSRQTARQHLNEIAKQLAQSSGALHYDLPASKTQPLFSEAQKEHLIRAFMHDHGHDLRQDITHHAEDFTHWLRKLEAELVEELDGLVDPHLAAQMRQLDVAILPHLECDAFVESVGNASDLSWAIGINLGQVYVSNLLAQALLCAAQGDAHVANRAYEAALHTYRAPAGDSTAVPWAGLPTMTDDAARQAAAAGSVVLRFVALHEVGHALLGHVGKWQMSISADGRRHYAAEVAADMAATQAMELEADAFALQRMMQRSAGLETMWNNLLFIAAFFRLLDHVQAMSGKPLCPYHPLPIQRVECLAQQLTAQIGPPPNDAWQWAKQQHEIWSKT